MLDKIKEFLAKHHWVIFVAIGLVAMLVIYLLLDSGSSNSSASNNDAAAEAAADQAAEQANALSVQQQEQSAAISATESEQDDQDNAAISVATLQAQTQQVEYNDETALGTTQSNNSLSATENTNASQVQLGTVESNNELSALETDYNDTMQTVLGQAQDSAAVDINATNAEATQAEQENANSAAIVQAALGAQTTQSYYALQTQVQNDYYNAQSSIAQTDAEIQIANK